MTHFQSIDFYLKIEWIVSYSWGVAIRFWNEMTISASDALKEALFCAQNSSKINSWQSKHIQSYFKGCFSKTCGNRSKNVKWIVDLPQSADPQPLESSVSCDMFLARILNEVSRGCPRSLSTKTDSFNSCFSKQILNQILRICNNHSRAQRMCNISCVPKHLLPFLSLLRLWSVHRSTLNLWNVLSVWILQCIVTHALQMRMHPKY